MHLALDVKKLSLIGPEGSFLDRTALVITFLQLSLPRHKFPHSYPHRGFVRIEPLVERYGAVLLHTARQATLGYRWSGRGADPALELRMIPDRSPPQATSPSFLKQLGKTPGDTWMKDKACLVVGAGDGAGTGIARAFAKEGYTVCITRRLRNLAQLELQAQSIRDGGGKAYAYGIDARDENQTVDLIQKIEAEIGPLEVAVFNIGVNVEFSGVETTARVPESMGNGVFLRILNGPGRCQSDYTARPGNNFVHWGDRLN
jgi:hypothetical protein